MISSYVGWLDKERWLANRAYFVVDKEGTVRFKKIMENPAELLPMEEISKVLQELK
jgi:alkyl hydroperoxide reductase subunit AhpC